MQVSRAVNQDRRLEQIGVERRRNEYLVGKEMSRRAAVDAGDANQRVALYRLFEQARPSFNSLTCTESFVHIDDTEPPTQLPLVSKDIHFPFCLKPSFVPFAAQPLCLLPRLGILTAGPKARSGKRPRTGPGVRAGAPLVRQARLRGAADTGEGRRCDGEPGGDAGRLGQGAQRLVFSLLCCRCWTRCSHCRVATRRCL